MHFDLQFCVKEIYNFLLLFFFLLVPWVYYSAGFKVLREDFMLSVSLRWGRYETEATGVLNTVLSCYCKQPWRLDVTILRKHNSNLTVLSFKMGGESQINEPYCSRLSFPKNTLEYIPPTGSFTELSLVIHMLRLYLLHLNLWLKWPKQYVKKDPIGHPKLGRNMPYTSP